MPFINIRWADNTPELTRHLKEGLNQIEATRASAEKMVQAMGGDKLMRAAHTWVAAVTQMGGAEKLTNAERERGIALLERAIEKYRVLGKEAPSALLATLNQTKALNQPLSQMVQGMTAAGQQATASGKMLAGMGASGQAAMAGIAKSTTSTVGPMTSMLGLAKSLGPAIGIGFSVGAVVNFGKSVLADADALVKLHDKTGISIEGLQMFRVAGDETGVALDSMTAAVTQIQNRLAGDDKSFHAALQKVGISVEAFKRLRPEDQYIAIADALRQIEDPAQQVALSIDLMGRVGAENLPVIKRGFEDLKDAAPGMSAEAVKALDDTGDAITRLWRNTKNAIAEATGQMIISLGKVDLGEAQGIGRTIGAQRGDQSFSGKHITSDFDLPDPLALGPSDITDFFAKRTRAVESYGTALTNVRTPAMLAAEAHQKFVDSVADATHRFTGGTLALHRYIAAIPGERSGPATFPASMFNLPSQSFGPTSFAGQMATPGAGMTSLFRSPSLTAGLADQFKTALPQAIIQSFAGGGSPVKAVGSLFGAQMGTNFVSKFGGSITGLLGKTVGGAVNAILPGIGSLIGPGLSALIGGIKKLFGGPSEAELKGRKESFDFQEQIAKSLTAQQKAEAGGDAWKMTMIGVRDAYIATGRSAAEAERIVRDLWNTKDPEAYKRAMQEIKGVLDEQKQDQTDLQAAIEKYRFTIDELGPVMQKQQLDEQAKTLLNDWRLLVGAGINMTVVNEKMADSINAYLQTAKRTGTEIPSAMRPILQTLIDQGKLVDENGNKITDLTESGLTFSETMTQGFDRVVNALNRVLVGLGLIPEALDAIPDNKTIRVDVDYRDSGLPDRPDDGGDGFDRGEGVGSFAARGGLVTLHGVQHFADGGMVMPRGTDSVPIMASPGEIIFNKEQQAFIGRHDAAILAELKTQTDLLARTRQTILQIENREIGRAVVQALDRGTDGLVTQFQELLGVT